MQTLEATTQQVPWEPKHILYVILWGGFINVVCYYALTYLLPFIPGALDFFKEGKGTGITMFFSYLIQLVSFLLPLYLIGKKLQIASWKETLGFHHISRNDMILYILLAQLTSFFVFGLLSFSMWTSNFREIPGYSGSQDPLSTFFGSSGQSYLLAFISVSILAPLVEELFFRGMIQSTLKKYIPAVAGIVLSASIFSLSHLELQVALPLFIMGLILGTLFHKTGSIIPGIVYHGINNALFILLEIWK